MQEERKKRYWGFIKEKFHRRSHIREGDLRTLVLLTSSFILNSKEPQQKQLRRAIQNG